MLRDAQDDNPVPTPELSLTKTSTYDDNDGSGDLSVDDVINYTVTASNTGTAVLTNVTVTDTFVTLTCVPANPVTLGLGESTVCTGCYTVQSTILGTTITNMASATSDSGRCSGRRRTTTRCRHLS